MYIYGSSNVINGSNFVNNRARHGSGGAIYASYSYISVTTHDSTYVNNVGFSGGGAIYISNNYASLIVNGTTFVNNLITGPNGNGGAVNVANTNALRIEFNNDVFINNSALNGSGGAVYTKRGITITDTIFGQNRAPLCAAFNVEQSYHDRSMSIATSTFLHNTAIGFTVRGNLGGVGCIRNTEISIQFCTFSHNSAAGGGGVLDVEDSIVNIEGSTFRNNTAGVDGGVFYTHAFPSSYMINESHLVNNRAGDDGGVLYLGRSGSSAEINRNSFTDNVATDRGGAVALFGSTVNVIDTNFQSNMANKGSAISACNSNGANIIPLNVQTDLTFPVCRLYDGSIQRYPEPQTHDNSNFDITAYFQRFIHGEEPSLPPPTIEFSSTTDTEVDPILLDIQSRLFGTSVITYLLFAFAVIFAVIVIVVIAVKFKRILKKRKMKKLPPDTANEDSESSELYEEPDWSIQREANPKQMEQNNRYNMQKRYVKK